MDGSCEEDDGISFRIVIQQSLRVVRVQHTHEIVSRGYDKLDNCELVMRPRGMTAFFNKLRRAKLELKEEGELVSDAYLLRTAWNKIRGKHDMLDDVISKLRTQAGISGIPTTFAQARNVLTDIFDFEVPMSLKKEKPLVPANYAFTGNKRKGDGDKDKYRKRQRRQFPKGSCKDCPEATDHTTASSSAD